MDSSKISNIMNKIKKPSENGGPPKSIMKIPMLSIKDIIVGSIGTVIPWIVLLFICTFLIII